MTPSPPLIVVAGATATGKTELSIRLAESYLAEGRPAAIISADSRQVYRGLDIGTAKATAADRARAPHRGLDLVDPDLPAFSAIGYREAWAVIDGSATRKEAIELDARRNVAFAKRQRTWFRSERAIRWLDPAYGDPLAPALALARTATD